MSTADALAAYHRGRDFAQTPEPRAGRTAALAGRTRHLFVVQEHHARNLHNDFRLELDGTLKSWAVPKGPSLDPAVKRMAVQVEDHPVAYADFEGEIPKGHYGAGQVQLWDRGSWTPVGDARAGLRDGHLKFDLAGDKLHGRWALVRMKPRDGERHLPFAAGRDLRDLPLQARRQQLREWLARAPSSGVRFSENFAGDPATLLASARDAGLEGLIAKRVDSPYRSARSADWVKLKTRLRQEFVIGGYTDPKGSRSGIGSLLLGVHDAEGAMHYAGNVGSGFDDATLSRLKARLEPLQTRRSPFADAPAKVGARGDSVPRWVAPSARGARGSARVTHPDRVVDASSGITKGELVDHFARVAGRLLPHLKQRPVALLRAPGGIEGAMFFQKHADQHALAGVTRLDPALDPGHEALLVVSSAAGVAAAAQLNTIEFHTWNMTARTMPRADRMVFDLDPGTGVDWPAVREAATLVRALLDEIGLASVLKTSGGKGLHVVVPLAPRHDWTLVRAFSQAVVQHLAAVIPQRFVAKSGPRNRVGRIFVDYLRNGWGTTTVAAWSPRARPGLGVSVPVDWSELPQIDSGAHWHLRNIAPRLVLGDAPWHGAAGASRQTLTRAMRALDFQPDKAPR